MIWWPTIDSRVGCISSAVYDEALTIEQNRSLAEQSVITNLNLLAQQWEKLLFAMGGAICLIKSFWCLISWTWTASGTAQLTTIQQSPGSLDLTAGHDTHVTMAVPRIESTAAYRTLGFRISPSGSNKLAKATLSSQSHEFAGSLLLGHLRLRDKTANLILIDLSYIQLLTGSTTLFFNLPFHPYSCLVEKSWLTSIWKLLYKIVFNIKVHMAFIPSTPRHQDQAIMDYLVTLKLPTKQDAAFTYRLFTYQTSFTDGKAILDCFKGQRIKPGNSSSTTLPTKPSFITKRVAELRPNYFNNPP